MFEECELVCFGRQRVKGIYSERERSRLAL